MKRAHQAFAASAEEWTAIAGLVQSAGRSRDAAVLRDAAQRCLRIADLEVEGMQALAAL